MVFCLHSLRQIQRNRKKTVRWDQRLQSGSLILEPLCVWSVQVNSPWRGEGITAGHAERLGNFLITFSFCHSVSLCDILDGTWLHHSNSFKGTLYYDTIVCIKNNMLVLFCFVGLGCFVFVFWVMVLWPTCVQPFNLLHVSYFALQSTVHDCFLLLQLHSTNEEC